MFSYLLIFIINIVIELGVAFILGYRKKEHILAITAINILTHPILNLALSVSFIIWGVIILEVLVVIAEWKLLEFTFKEKHRKYLLLAFAMNFTSYLLGSILIQGFLYI